MKRISIAALFLISGFQVQVINAEESDPAEIAIGERLTLETRFAQLYYADKNQADSVLNTTQTTISALPGAFAGSTMNCRACHMVDEFAENPAAGMRSYADFAVRPPVPTRSDNNKTSLRNSMSMVNIAMPRAQGELFHYDGEFNSMENLVRATLTGRNYGWLPGEADIAIKHIADIVRQDDGRGKLAQEFGGRYRKVLQGTASDLPEELRLPEMYRIDVNSATDSEIVDIVAKLISVYVNDLAFSQQQGIYDASPYDLFLKKNGLPAKPESGESDVDYNQRLLNSLKNLKSVKFVRQGDRQFTTHKQEYVFGEKELLGMKLFFSPGDNEQHGGNCASCHTAPHFSDFSFHNTGLTQQNYDQLHGVDAFVNMNIPGLQKRNDNYNDYLPATEKHPQASSRFRSLPSKNHPGYTDLGLWNVFANPDMPEPQAKLKAILCKQVQYDTDNDCSDEKLLPMTVARFKTPVLRDLGHSSPYMHTGQFDSLQQSVAMYINSSGMAKAGRLRNADDALHHIHLTENDVENMVAFLKSLNEDYE